jgi:hypothetical protein
MTRFHHVMEEIELQRLAGTAQIQPHWLHNLSVRNSADEGQANGVATSACRNKEMAS